MKGQNMMMRHTKRGLLAGGAVALLRDSVEKSPILGSGIGANKPVGIISPAPPTTISTNIKPKPTVFQGGELLNKISFEPHKNRDNIKFIF